MTTQEPREENFLEAWLRTASPEMLQTLGELARLDALYGNLPTPIAELPQAVQVGEPSE
jgi:hypothetical protein